MRFDRATGILTILAITGLGLGCAFGEIHWDDPLKRQVALQESQKRYSDLIRWSEFKKASAFIEPDERADFLRRMPDFADMRFTDYETEPVETNDESRASAKVLVTYTGYRMTSPLETDIEETQTWSRSDVLNTWVVSSSFSQSAPHAASAKD